MPDNEKRMSAAAADLLLDAHDGDVALLYLYLCRGGSPDAESAARRLVRTRVEMEAALEKLGRMGLLPEEPAAKPTPVKPPAPTSPQPLQAAEELPDYRAEDIVRRSREDSAFSGILAEAQKVLGHTLSTPDLKRLFGIYDYLALPPEVIMVLLHHCVAAAGGRLPSMRAIEKEAYAWVRLEIVTLEQAEDYLAAEHRRQELVAQAAAALGIRGRELTNTENRYLTAWLELGFGVEAIALAADRTVTNTGALKWGYCNKIIQSWNEQGLHTVQEIEARDSRRPAAPARRPKDKRELDALLTALDQI